MMISIKEHNKRIESLKRDFEEEVKNMLKEFRAQSNELRDQSNQIRDLVEISVKNFDEVMESENNLKNEMRAVRKELEAKDELIKSLKDKLMMYGLANIASTVANGQTFVLLTKILNLAVSKVRLAISFQVRQFFTLRFNICVI